MPRGEGGAAERADARARPFAGVGAGCTCRLARASSRGSMRRGSSAAAVDFSLWLAKKGKGMGGLGPQRKFDFTPNPSSFRRAEQNQKSTASGAGAAEQVGAATCAAIARIRRGGVRPAGGLCRAAAGVRGGAVDPEKDRVLRGLTVPRGGGSTAIVMGSGRANARRVRASESSGCDFCAIQRDSVSQGSPIRREGRPNGKVPWVGGKWNAIGDIRGKPGVTRAKFDRSLSSGGPYRYAGLPPRSHGRAAATAATDERQADLFRLPATEQQFPILSAGACLDPSKLVKVDQEPPAMNDKHRESSPPCHIRQSFVGSERKSCGKLRNPAPPIRDRNIRNAR